MATKRVILCGFGTVGKAFAHLLLERHRQVIDKYGLNIKIAAVVASGGAAVSDQGALPLDSLLAHVDAGNKVETFLTHGRTGLSGVQAITEIPAEVLLETTPTNLVDGEPARAHISAALNRGLDVVSANKGPLVLFHREILALAKNTGRRIFMSAATAAALPTLDVGLMSTAGANVLAAEGILNGTTNYILTRMHVDLCEYEAALKAAREMGIAETDPTLDVEGLDTRNKLLILSNCIFGKDLGPDDVAVEGITGVSSADIFKAVLDDKVIKLMGSAEWNNGEVKVSVAPKALEKTHPLAAVNYAEKGISFLTDTMGRITVTGGKSSPEGAAAALLKDLIHTEMLTN